MQAGMHANLQKSLDGRMSSNPWAELAKWSLIKFEMNIHLICGSNDPQKSLFRESLVRVIYKKDLAQTRMRLGLFFLYAWPDAQIYSSILQNTRIDSVA